MLDAHAVTGEGEPDLLIADPPNDLRDAVE